LGIRHKTVKSSGDKLYASEWNEPHVIESGASFPSSPSEGDLFYRSDEHRIYYYNGSEWKPVADIPTGRVKLPEPSTSDWITPDSVEASSEYSNLLASDNTEVNKYNTGGEWELAKTLSFSENMVGKLRYNVKSSASGYEASVKVELLKNGSVVYTTEKTVTVTTYQEYTEYPNVEADEAKLYLKTQYGVGMRAYNSLFEIHEHRRDDNAIDENTATYWMPNPANQTGAWLKMDTGSLQIIGAIRIHFPVASYIPESFKIEGSEDGSEWETLLTGQTGSEGWNTYTFNARYIRYLRITVENYGTANGIKIAETDYYSRITERVAALHGHGSGVVRFRRGHGERLSDDVRREVLEALNEFRQASAQERFTKLEMYLLLLEKRIRMLEDLTGV